MFPVRLYCLFLSFDLHCISMLKTSPCCGLNFDAIDLPHSLYESLASSSFQVMPIFLPLKKANFRCLFGLNPFSRQKGRLSPSACHTYLKSLCINGQFWLSGNHFCASYEALDFCWQIGLNFLQYLRPYRILFCIVTWQTCEPKAHHCVVLASNYLSSWLRFSPI